jgi:hypothetical protein
MTRASVTREAARPWEQPNNGSRAPELVPSAIE